MQRGDSFEIIAGRDTIGGVLGSNHPSVWTHGQGQPHGF